jgi:hypothetical protein
MSREIPLPRQAANDRLAVVAAASACGQMLKGPDCSSVRLFFSLFFSKDSAGWGRGLDSRQVKCREALFFLKGINGE